MDDMDSRYYLDSLKARELTKANRVPGVQKVLVVLSSAGMVYDAEAIRHKILLFYPESAVFFRATSGRPLGIESPKQVDLIIDLTGPRQRSPLFYASKLRRMGRFVVGRNAGFLRKRIYDRIFDEKSKSDLPGDLLERERVVQREVLALAGVAMIPVGLATPDRSKEIALELPPLARG